MSLDIFETRMCVIGGHPVPPSLMISGDRERTTVSFPIGVQRSSVSRVQHIGRSSPRLVLLIEIMERNLYLGEKTLEGHAFESVEDRMELERYQSHRMNFFSVQERRLSKRVLSVKTPS